jgi:hypothetical protein
LPSPQFEWSAVIADGMTHGTNRPLDVVPNVAIRFCSASNWRTFSRKRLTYARSHILWGSDLVVDLHDRCSSVAVAPERGQFPGEQLSVVPDADQRRRAAASKYDAANMPHADRSKAGQELTQ